MVSAWRSDTWWWDDLGHGLGAFVTSAGFAGVAALLAASVAAYQVSGTRADDRKAATVGAAAKRRDQLWQRFEWVAAAQRHMGATATVNMLVGIEGDARNEADSNLAHIVTVFRWRMVVQTDPNQFSPGQS